MSTVLLLMVAAGVAGVTVIATGAVVHYLRRRNILDRPNVRSSHTQPTPRGGGLAVIPVIVAAWAAAAALLGGPLAASAMAVTGAALALAVVSWIDDVRGLGPAVRFGAQAVAVIAVLAVGGLAASNGGGIWIAAVTAVAWLWFTNLYNFMDGIDGLTGIETASIGGGVALVAAAAGLDTLLIVAGVTAAAASIGFLRWNWQPAAVFLGDVGSVPLGLMVGWLLLALANAGHVIPALILPLYYMADATLTLGHRLVRGETPWQAHRTHFYQRAVAAGRSHAQVVRHVLAANVVLVLLAMVAVTGRADMALAGAGIVVAALLMVLGGRRKSAARQTERSSGSCGRGRRGGPGP